MEETFNKFRELGYIVQEPTKDKTLFLVRQELGGTILIFVKLYKKEVEVYSYRMTKNKMVDYLLTDYEQELLLEYVVELGYTEYEMVKDRV